MWWVVVGGGQFVTQLKMQLSNPSTYKTFPSGIVKVFVSFNSDKGFVFQSGEPAGWWLYN